MVDQSGLLNEAARVLGSLELSRNRGRHLSSDTHRVQLRVQKLQHTLTHMNVTEQHCWGQTHRPVNRWERTRTDAEHPHSTVAERQEGLCWNAMSLKSLCSVFSVHLSAEHVTGVSEHGRNSHTLLIVALLTRLWNNFSLKPRSHVQHFPKMFQCYSLGGGCIRATADSVGNAHWQLKIS